MMLLSSVLFSFMSALIRGMPEVNAYTMVMMRFVVGTLGVVVLFVVGVDQMRWTNWNWIIARGLSGGIACVLSYWSIQHLGLAKALMLSYSYVAFAAIFAVPILHERLRPRHWMAIGVAMTGVALLCGVQNLSVTWADTAALACGVTSAFAVVALTKSRETDSAANIFWSQSLFGIGVAAWPTYTNWVMPTPAQWSLLVTIGLLAMAGQLSMTYAYKYTGAAYGSLMSLLSPILGSVIGILYFRETQGPAFFAGAALILFSCCFLSLNPIERPGAAPAPAVDQPVMVGGE